MVDRHADEVEIRELVDDLVAAIRAMDVDRLRTIFTADVVSFDIVPPLQHVGLDAKLRNWSNAFAAHRPPLGYEVHDLTIEVGDDVAFARSLNRIRGTLQDGRTTDQWVRWTGGLRKADGSWRIAHDQVSVPIDERSGQALRDLEP